jgi:hypothetical protein
MTATNLLRAIQSLFASHDDFLDWLDGHPYSLRRGVLPDQHLPNVIENNTIPKPRTGKPPKPR